MVYYIKYLFLQNSTYMRYRDEKTKQKQEMVIETEPGIYIIILL